MRLTVFLLLFAEFLNASPNGLSQTVSLKVNNAKLEKVMRAIKDQTGLTFVYTEGLKQKSMPITLNLNKVPLSEALSKVFSNQPFTFKIIDNVIVIDTKNMVTPSVELKTTASEDIVLLLPPPPVTIKGKVTDDEGKPLAGASVKVVGTQSGATTDEQGNFVISLSSDTKLPVKLEISYISYATVIVNAHENEPIKVSLKKSAVTTEEVVVVGYGTQRKENLTGSVATVSSKELDSRPLTNLGSGLEGLIPNLNVNLNDGQPGTSASFNIRGFTTIGNNSSSAPLVLIDGVVRDPNLIDPNEVASVTVLKDAASAAIYGGRAANGVILITTKSPKAGRTQLSYSGSYTLTRPTNLPKYLNSHDFIKIFNEAARTGAATGGYTPYTPFYAQDSIMVDAYMKDPAHNPDTWIDPGNPNLYRYVSNTDWIKVLYPGTAPMQQHFISMSGGESKTSYVADMGYFRQEGLEKVANQIYEKYNPSLKVNTEVTNWLAFNLNVSMTHTQNNGPATTRAGQGGSWIPSDLRPLMPVYNPDGHFSGQGNYTNPVAVMTLSGRDIDIKNDLWTTGKVIIKPIKNITFIGDYTWNYYADNERSNMIPYNEYGVNGVFLDIFPWTNPSSVTENRWNNNYHAFNAYLTYENTFAQKHYFKVMAGYNQEYQHYQYVSAYAKNLLVPTIPAIGLNNDSKPTVSGTETEYALVGTFFRLNYVFNKKYLIEVNGRYDGSSRFQQDSRYVFSPSVSVGWQVAEEKFMESLKNKGIVNELKIRASYGQLPNQLSVNSVGNTYQYPYISTMSTGTVGYLFNGQPGITVSAPGLVSSNFTWEKVQTQNIAVDFSLLDKKLSGSFDYYITNRKDMVVAGKQLPALLGTSAPAVNAANLRTNGWELSLTWKDALLDKKLGYSVVVGLSDNYSTITKYNNNTALSLTDYLPGRRLGEIWGFVTEGFYKTDAEAASVDNSALAGYKWLAGDIKYADLNHDGKISYGANTLTNPGDQKVIGNSTPRYKFGVTLNLNYKEFDFAAFFQGLLKMDFDPTGSNVFYAFPNNEWNLPYIYAMNYWTPNNPNAYFARPRFAGWGNNQTQTKYLQNAAFGRLKQVTLGYTLPRKLISQIKLQRIRVYITGENLITLTHMYKGFDPELISFGGGYQTYPINRAVSFGLQVGL